MRKTKIDPQKLGKAGAIVAGFLWTVYSVAGLLLFFLAINLSGNFAYTDFMNFDWQPTIVKFISYFYVLSLGAMLTGKMTAEIYNFLVDEFDTRLP